MFEALTPKTSEEEREIQIKRNDYEEGAAGRAIKKTINRRFEEKDAPMITPQEVMHSEASSRDRDMEHFRLTDRQFDEYEKIKDTKMRERPQEFKEYLEKNKITMSDEVEGAIVDWIRDRDKSIKNNEETALENDKEKSGINNEETALENIERLIISGDPKLIMEGMKKIYDLRGQKIRSKEKGILSDKDEEGLFKEGMNGIVDSENEELIREGLEKFSNFCDDSTLEKGINKLLKSNNIDTVKYAANRLSNLKSAQLISLKTRFHSISKENESLKGDMDKIRDLRAKF